MTATNAPKIDTATLLANLKTKADTPAVPVEVAAVSSAVTPAAPVIKEAASPDSPELVAEYQQYTSARISTCLITNKGKRINFSSYQYYTKDSEIIRYLDKEIAAGLGGFVKGKLLTAAELDPEATKRRKIIEEFKASQEGREFGNTKPKAQRNSALSSDQVAN